MRLYSFNQLWAKSTAKPQCHSVGGTPAATGISFENNLVYKDNVNILEYLYYYNGGGVAVGDINNDGLEDLFFTANQGSDKLLFKSRDLKFKDDYSQANIYTDDSWSSGVAMEDVNNDGFLDIFVAKVGTTKACKRIIFYT